MERYRRHLPHLAPAGMPIFLTWNLHGALPRAALARLQRERERLQAQGPRPGESPRERRLREGKLLFAAADAMLDGAQAGPFHLRDPQAAAIVEEAVLFGAVRQPFEAVENEDNIQRQERQAGKPVVRGGRAAEGRYDLFAWCVMPNHVHVVLAPRVELRRITQGIKGFTARRINALFGATGRRLWHDESYDHYARDDEELARIVAYVEANPVKAGLCGRPEEWRWSSARFRRGWRVGEPWREELGDG